MATVIPEIGFDDAPICPVMRLDTVTNRNANPTASSAARRLIPIWGSAIIAIAHATTPPSTTVIGMSRSVRGRAVPLERSSALRRKPPTSAATIVGIDRRRLINPAAVTAPAPM